MLDGPTQTVNINHIDHMNTLIYLLVFLAAGANCKISGWSESRATYIVKWLTVSALTGLVTFASLNISLADGLASQQGLQALTWGATCRILWFGWTITALLSLRKDPKPQLALICALAFAKCFNIV